MNQRFLSRGEEYFLSGACGEPEIDGNTVRAKVTGSDIYDVEITFEDGYAVDMHCSCPYAAGDNNCKHMAALLYSLDDTTTPAHINENSVRRQSPLACIDWKRSIPDIVSELSDEEVRGFLLDLADELPSVEQRIRIKFANNIPEATDVMKAQIHNIIQGAGGDYGYIDYEEAFDCMWELCDFLRDNVPQLIEKHAYLEAFELVCDTFSEAAYTEMDDSDGGLTMLMEYCSECWADIVGGADPDSQIQMYHWFTSHLNGRFESYVEEYIENAIFQFFSKPELLKSSLDYAEKMLESCSDYRTEYYVRHALVIMGKLNFSGAELQDFRLKYRYLPYIRKLEVEDALNGQQYDRAVELLRESIEIDRDDFRLVADYKEKIIEIYETTGQEDLLLEALNNYIRLYPQDDLTYILKYKALLSVEEWSSALDGLLAMFSLKYVKCELLFSEGRYRELFDEVKKRKYLQTFLEYEKILRDKFPEEALSYYAQLLSAKMDAASDRNHYADVVSHFKALLYYPNGEDQVLYLAKKWRCSYPRRRAMLDEISKALKQCGVG